jgi:membrane-associated protease RseP (regulator of RpoE activity)
VPVLFLFTGAHNEYHTPGDDPDLVNFEGMVHIGAFAYRLAFYLAAAPERPLYTQADVRRGGDRGGSGGRGYGAYLGTVPSFGEFEGKGVKLQGVRPGSPAQKAGVMPGDVIVGIDDAEIDDLYAFTYALRDHKSGDAVVVKVSRNGELLELNAVLGERKK